MGIWDRTYRESLAGIAERFAKDAVPRAILGFHTTIDGIKRVVPEEVERVLSEDPALAERVRARLGATPEEINTAEDLLVALLDSMSRGKALQRMIRSEAVFNWTMGHFGYDRLRIGGTSGNMANLLAPVGFPEILLYVNPLTREQAELLVPNPNLKVIARTGRGFTTKHPHDAWTGEGVKALHWVFEYPKGVRVEAGGISVEAPRANRFIAAWNPVNNRLRLVDTFTHGLPSVVDRFSHFIISGFHIVSEKYPDGSTSEDCLKPVAAFISHIKAIAPHLTLHYEFASIGSAAVRTGVVQHILPLVHSLGLNEVELVTLLRDVGEERLGERIETSEDIGDVFEGTRVLAERLGLPRVHLHNLGYYLCLTRPDYATAAQSLDGLVFAASVAAARTATGRIESRSDILRDGLAVPISEAGLENASKLGKHLELPGFEETGIAPAGSSPVTGGFEVSFVPTRVVAEPVLTVGLGDLISSSAFLLGTG
ncbi:MAG: hypothetical protein NUW23_10120 [Firmicutes bacterium]|nr:hypothetical protein [Bacillota bacterium]